MMNSTIAKPSPAPFGEKMVKMVDYNKDELSSNIQLMHLTSFFHNNRQFSLVLTANTCSIPTSSHAFRYFDQDYITGQLQPTLWNVLRRPMDITTYTTRSNHSIHLGIILLEEPILLCGYFSPD